MQTIESFRSSVPDQFNGQNPTGDPSNDWLPAFKRAQDFYLNKVPQPGVEWRMYNTPIVGHIAIGETQRIYGLSGPLDLFGIEIFGTRDDVEIYFPSGTNGITLHHPKISIFLGTHDSQYGGHVTMRNVRLRGSNGAGTVGLRCHSVMELYNVEVWDFGWHGIYVDADARRPRVSNANLWYMFRCECNRNGRNPGTRVAADGTVVQNPWGAGLYIDGGDTNVGYNEQFSAIHNAGFGIDDSSFLGCTHISPHVADNGHIVTQLDIDLKLNTYDRVIGEFLPLGYKGTGGNQRTLWDNPYVEGPTTVFDAPSPNLVVLGIGGRLTTATRRISAGTFQGPWKFASTDAKGNTYETSFGDDRNLLTFKSSADDSRPYRFKFVPLPSGSDKAEGHAGFYRMDWANLNVAVPFLMTSTKSKAPDGRVLPPGRFVELERFAGPSMLPVSYGTQPPTTGVWPVGSIVHNTKPSAGGFMGWTVVGFVSGTLPIWKGFGAIEP